MTLCDKELLELAAKAAEYEVKITNVVPCYRGDPTFECFIRNKRLDRRADWTPWNPLTDDGDALRLAVNRNIFRCHMDLFHLFYEEEIANRVDESTATRRAIVRAAAEI